eukprot:TRINITY_DN4592_c0_g1_i1.p1 TRINITY_DN4592_c0_g1~~TRINITY_DN4592_c0_g1_i1.p1  ORF type:complete len:533 (+),score=151.36 TRINITY_DN4592_c0_g1_i1:67-1665(+)
MAGLIVEFQVVILAGGPGSRMYPLTTEVPKALLPIANRPMISYQLELLERVGFSDVIIITQQDTAQELKTFVDEIYEGKILVDWVLLSEFMGTAEALKILKNQNKLVSRDVIVLSCDLIADSTFITDMADFHRINDSSATVLLYQPPPEQESLYKTLKNEYGLMDYIGLDPNTNRILYKAPAADVEEKFEIPKALLRHHPRITIHTSLVDPHFYIFSRAILDLFLSSPKDSNNSSSSKDNNNNNNSNTSSSSGSNSNGITIPSTPNVGIPATPNIHLTSSPPKFHKPHSNPSNPNNLSSPSPAPSPSSTPASSSSSFPNLSSPLVSIQAELLPTLISSQFLPPSAVPPSSLPPFRLSSLLSSSPLPSLSPISVFAYIKTTGYCTRSNTIKSYLQVNKDITTPGMSSYAPWETKVGKYWSHGSVVVDGKSVVGAESVVGEGSVVGGRCGVKKSVVGKHCRLEGGVKVVNSVVMDHVVIGEGSSISGSVVCSNVYMKKGCVIKDAFVGYACHLSEGTEVKNDVFVETNRGTSGI